MPVTNLRFFFRPGCACRQLLSITGDQPLAVYRKGSGLGRRFHTARNPFSGRPTSAPTRRIRSGCCARASSGHAAAPLASVKNSRRLNR